jgi:hypothetical protein
MLQAVAAMNSPSPDPPAPAAGAIRSVTADRIRSGSLRELLAYWENKERLLGRMPARADLQPDEMVPFLPFVSLIDVQQQPLRFRFRLVGTGIVSAFGRESTSRMVDEDLFGSNAEEVERFFSIPLQTHGAAYAAGEYAVVPSGRTLGFETLLLPLSTEGTAIDMLLGGLVGQRLRPEEQVSGFRYDFYCPVVQTAAG